VQATLSGNAIPTQAAGVSGLTMQFGGLTGAPGGQAFVDNSNFAALESQTNPQQMVINGTATQPNGQLYLVSSGAAGAPTNLLPPGASYCQCQFLQWGYWGGDLTTANSSNPATPRIDRGGINTWVAGVATPQSNLNSLISQSATASYSGHAIGSVFNNGASYLAAGGFNGTYNFGTQIGQVAVTNFDGHNFVAGGKAPLTGANYSFSGSPAPGFTGTVNGTFFGPNAAETGGNFAVQTTTGPTYIASGIFAGKR
jgi:trimeric autotransporter adhesin